MQSFDGKILLITGGTGSFGNATLKRFIKTDIKEIRILSRDEKKQDDMRNLYLDERIKYYIGDVRDYQSIEKSFLGVNYVFHAAALKQVPSCEFYPIEAVKTNVIGTENVLNASVANKVEKVICLSTDKAVYPINSMGITKALMEKLCISQARLYSQTATRISCTRYGNVMGSRGSVIPLFISQILADQNITITNPYMTRFMMSLDDAIDLVLFAFENMTSGDIFVQKSPACSIDVLAKALSSVFNKDNHPITTIGNRHGEKLFETLLSTEEKVTAIEYEKYYKIPMDVRSLDYHKYIDVGFTNSSPSANHDEYNSSNTVQLSIEQCKSLLYSLECVNKHLIF